MLAIGFELLKQYGMTHTSVEDTIYPYLTTTDEAKLQAALPDDFVVDVELEIHTIDSFLVHMEGVKDSLDYPVIANLMKTFALVQEANEMMHQEALDRTLDAMFELLFSLIFYPED